MSTPTPLTFVWDGEHMVPDRPRQADKEYCVGERYRLGVIEERSGNSHRHYFAALNEAHTNLPEHLADQFPTMEGLRKFALIQTGFRDERSIPCSSKAEALRVAAFVKPMDEYAVVVTAGATVTVLTAKSQSQKAMGAEAFKRSKDAVLEYVSAMIDVSRKALEDHARAA